VQFDFESNTKLMMKIEIETKKEEEIETQKKNQIKK